MSLRVSIRSKPSSKAVHDRLASADSDISWEQIDAWTGTGSATIAVWPELDAKPVSAPEPAIWHFGDLVMTSLRQSFPSPPHWPPHLPDHGCVVLLSSRHPARTAASVLIMSPHAGLDPATLPWPAGHSGLDCDVLTLFMPITACDGAAPAAAASHLDSSAGHGALLAGFMRQLAGHLGQIPEHRRGMLADATHQLVMACMGEPAPRPAPLSHRPKAGMVERMRAVVQQNMGSPEFGPQQLARLLAMSRSKLYRLLDGDGGVARFINSERLSQAARDLATADEAVSVQAIASRAGFRDHSTFSRAFRRAFGCSPSQAREQALLALPDPIPLPGAERAVQAAAQSCGGAPPAR
ncbi:AraC family transcriptional regulator [Bosea sp. Root381]|uniref:AraC family transcriptional regulator n=1 Tax=Bosea sp. Root381 TaxID=1736524 RepID=UPI000AC4F139|nr:AraC family transcriptional regulator [Bosea sp. Root381]